MDAVACRGTFRNWDYPDPGGRSSSGFRIRPFRGASMCRHLAWLARRNRSVTS
ncbi:hypothetical protein SALBM311S_05846 [Streptomyces alboniger]